MKRRLMIFTTLVLTFCLLFSSCTLFEKAQEPIPGQESDKQEQPNEQKKEDDKPKQNTPQPQKFGDDEPTDESAEHTHVWGEGVVIKEAGDEPGEKEYTCLVCGAKTRLSIAPHVNLVAAFPRRVTEDLSKEEQTRREEILADYGWRLYSEILTEQQADTPGENQLFSPLSLEFAFCMVANGAAGETRAEIEAAMGLTVEEMNETLCGIFTRVEESKYGTAILANSIWMKDDGSFRVQPDFLQAVADYYEAQVYKEPLDAGTLERLNSWVNEYTRGMIPHLLDSIDPTTVMLLVNVLTFEDQWATPYEEFQIKENQTFHNYAGDEASVTFLSSNESFFVEGSGFTGFIKFYEGPYRILFLLPDEGLDVYEAMGAMTGADYRALYQGASTKVEVRAKVPEFSYDCSYDLISPLESTGMELPFSPGEADFSLLGESAFGNIFIGMVLQKTHIELNRNGTKAAAATVIGMKATSVSPMDKIVREVILDRPFGYVIFDSVTGTPLFTGITATLED